MNVILFGSHFPNMAGNSEINWPILFGCVCVCAYVFNELNKISSIDKYNNDSLGYVKERISFMHVSFLSEGWGRIELLFKIHTY